VETVTKAIQAAMWQATADREDTCITIRCPIKLEEKLHEKRRARQRWQLTKSPADKQTYNRLAKELKKLRYQLKHDSIQDYLRGLTPTEATEYSLWEATRKIKQPKQQIPPIRKGDNNWARTDQQKATTFAEHLCAELALTSLTSGGRLVGIVRLRTEATEFSVFVCLFEFCFIYEKFVICR
jgi:hypothetical protein